MSVILPETAQEQWLGRGGQRDTNKLQRLLVPYAEELTAYPVSELVNSPRNGADLFNPLSK